MKSDESGKLQLWFPELKMSGSGSEIVCRLSGTFIVASKNVSASPSIRRYASTKRFFVHLFIDIFSIINNNPV